MTGIFSSYLGTCVHKKGLCNHWLVSSHFAIICRSIFFSLQHWPREILSKSCFLECLEPLVNSVVFLLLRSNLGEKLLCSWIIKPASLSPSSYHFVPLLISSSQYEHYCQSLRTGETTLKNTKQNQGYRTTRILLHCWWKCQLAQVSGKQFASIL